MGRNFITRRDAVRLGLAAATVGLPTRARAAGLTIGFIYVGPKDDYGYNQAHAEGASAVKSMSNVTVIEQEKVAETIDVQKTMESMIKLDGASLLFPTSFGYFDPHMLAMCVKYPSIQFRHCGGLWSKDKHPANAGSYFGYIGMGQYLNGVIAGHATKSKKLGFVAAKPIPQVLLNINSFTLGARSVDQGIDVITCHVDGPKVVVQTAAGRGAFVCGYHANQAPLAPEKYLTGAEWNWANVYKIYATKFLGGETLPNFTRG